jgi:hypothetical protein
MVGHAAHRDALRRVSATPSIGRDLPGIVEKHLVEVAQTEQQQHRPGRQLGAGCRRYWRIIGVSFSVAMAVCS